MPALFSYDIFTTFHVLPLSVLLITNRTIAPAYSLCCAKISHIIVCDNLKTVKKVITNGIGGILCEIQDLYIPFAEALIQCRSLHKQKERKESEDLNILQQKNEKKKQSISCIVRSGNFLVLCNTNFRMYSKIKHAFCTGAGY